MTKTYYVSDFIAHNATSMRTHCINNDVECQELTNAVANLAGNRKVIGSDYSVLKNAAFQYTAIRDCLNAKRA